MSKFTATIIGSKSKVFTSVSNELEISNVLLITRENFHILNQSEIVDFGNVFVFAICSRTEESIRLYESDINIISMSFYSNFTENINKLDISNKDKIKSIAQVSEYLVEGEIYSDYYWKNKISSCEIYQGVNHIIAPKFVMNKLVKKDKSKNETKWDFTGKRIFYLNPHIMERFWKISLANQIYSNTHLPYLIELIWNLLKSHKYRSQEWCSHIRARPG